MMANAFIPSPRMATSAMPSGCVSGSPVAPASGAVLERLVQGERLIHIADMP